MTALKSRLKCELTCMLVPSQGAEVVMVMRNVVIVERDADDHEVCGEEDVC